MAYNDETIEIDICKNISLSLSFSPHIYLCIYSYQMQQMQHDAIEKRFNLLLLMEINIISSS